jgi:hypothetical protein
MPLAEVLVTVTATGFENLPAAIDSANHAYALVTVGARTFGRSRRIAASGDFDLTAEREPWEIALALPAGATIPVAFEIVDDRGDTAPNVLATGTRTLSGPFADGEVVISAASGADLKVTLAVVRARTARAPARVARAGSPNAPSGVLRPPRSIVLEFTAIRGLNKPGHTPPGLTRPHRRAEHDPNYFSEDDRGRIYTDSKLDGTWRRDRQCIELDVRIHSQGTNLSGSKVKWTLLDPDDPSNDRKEVHREAGRYFDPNDYDAAGTHIGALGDDNIRAFNEAGTGGPGHIFDRLPPWEALRGFRVSAATNTSCETTIDTAGESKVRLHCPDVGGTNLIVQAELNAVPAGVPVIPARTGVMTMWKRLDVEVVRMQGAWQLAPAKLESIADEYEPAFVQLDFHPETVAANTRRASPDHMAPNDNVVEDRVNAWIRRVSRHRRHPGWFFLGIAKRAHPPQPGASSPPLFDSDDPGNAWTHGGLGAREFIQVNKPVAANAAVVVFSWNHPKTGGGTQRVQLFWIVARQTRTASTTKFELFGHDLSSRFTGHDSNGSITHATQSELDFFPVGILNAAGSAVAGQSYNVPVSGANQARVVVLASNPGETSGISPGPPDFFAGKTVVFSHHPAFADHGTPAAPKVPPDQRPQFVAEVPSTVTHEFAHAFGMPHKCGFWDFRTPREKSCCMNYFSHWLLVPGNTQALDPFTEDKMGPGLCARHAMEIRRVHLKRNRALRWR